VPKTFPPKFDQNILYPSILNLDEIDMSGSPIGNNGYVSLGTYFDVSFGDNPTNASPILSYGKHGFRISINPDPVSSGYPILKQGSRILFEVKDSRGLVIFSDITPLHSSNNLKFVGYLWIKQDPLRTYEIITEGGATMTIVGVADVPNPHWRNIYNVRSSISLNLDLTTEVTNDDNTTQFYYNENTSPIIFKNPNKMTSGSGALFMSESFKAFDPNTNLDDVSVVEISASNLQTFGGKVDYISTWFWRSGSTAWEELGIQALTGYSTVFEEDIHADYAEGINPVSVDWKHQLYADQCPSGADGKNKMKFRLKFHNVIGQSALNTYPFSGSVSTGNEFFMDYPVGDPSDSNYIDSDNSWLLFEGTGMTLSGTTRFIASNNTLVKTSAGMFSFNVGSLSTRGGLTYNDEGEPGISDEPTKPNL